MSQRECKRAVIDIGSNTIRLVIYQNNGCGRFKEANNIKTVARLRRFLNNDGILEKKGIRLLVTILKGFKGILSYHQIQHVKCVATAAIRQALNKKEILETVETETGFQLTVLSGKEEAYYGYFAVIHTTPVHEAVTVDIGGGSTEVTYFKDRELIESHSFPFGVVSLKEQFISGETITDGEKKRLVAFINQSLQSLPWLKGLHVPIVAIGGSARNIAQIDQNIKNYPLAGIHQYTMTQKDLREILSLVEAMTIGQLEKLEGLSGDRTDIIQPALTVFVQISEFVKSDYFMFSRKGLREGVFFKEYEKRAAIPVTDDIVKGNIEELMHDYQINLPHSEHIANLAKQMFSQLKTLYGWKESTDDWKLLDLSARVYFLGKYVDSDVSSQHTFYLLANHPIEGLTHKDRLKLALIASFKNKNLFKQYMNPFIKYFANEELHRLRILGSLVKLAASLDASKRGIIKKVKMRQDKTGRITMEFYGDGNLFVEQYQAEKHVRQLEKALKNEIVLTFTPPA